MLLHDRFWLRIEKIYSAVSAKKPSIQPYIKIKGECIKAEDGVF
jgi:hypothetical protein